MDIVDTQVHVGRGGADATLLTMDALRIDSVLIDEFWGTCDSACDPAHFHPGFALPNGAWRTAFPTAVEASLLHPDRFSYLVRIDRKDPQLESVMQVVASSPAARAFRLMPVWTLAEAEAFASGDYEPVFAIADGLNLPVCLFIPGYVEHLVRYVKAHPKLTFVIDHCGMGFEGIPKGRPTAEAELARSSSYFNQILKLAEHPNVVLKWSHAQSLFDVGAYPYEELRPILRHAIHAFGANRIMWASDKSVIFDHTWPELLNSIRDSPDLSQNEKEWILGRTARSVLKWPASKNLSTVASRLPIP